MINEKLQAITYMTIAMWAATAFTVAFAVEQTGETFPLLFLIGAFFVTLIMGALGYSEK